VTFTVSTIPEVPNLYYQFNAGDGSPIQHGKTPRIQHIYTSPRNYAASVTLVGSEWPSRAGLTISVDRPSPSPPYAPGLFPTVVATATPSIRPTPTATPRLEVYLSVDKNPSSVGKNITFSISTNKNRPHLYELNFGDKSKRFQTRSNSVPHIFKAPGKYTISVRVLDDRSHPRADLRIFIDRRPPWLYIIMAGLAAVALLLYGILKLLFLWPTFHPYWDWSSPQKQPESVTVNYELHFEPNLSKGRQRLETRGASLIISKKRKQ